MDLNNYINQTEKIYLIVGAVGVANTMFTSVLEKTKEIGVMKAIGAKNKNILIIFLLNSGMFGLVGGMLGVLFGSIISYIFPTIGISLGGGHEGGQLRTAISFNLLFYALALSIVIGMLARVIPAYQHLS